MRVNRRLLLPALAVAALLSASVPRSGAQDQLVVLDRVAVDLEVWPDGRVLVTEDQTLEFQQGTFTFAFAELATNGATDIEIIEVGEPGRRYVLGDGDPFTYRVTRGTGHVELRWWFPETEGAQRRFLLTYVLHGALRFYEDGDQLWWKAIRADRIGAIRDARITVRLPGGVPGVTRAGASGRPGGGSPVDVEHIDERTVQMRVADVPPGVEIEASVEWPHGFVLGTPSPFQERLDGERAAEGARIEAGRAPGEAESRMALLNLVVALMSLLTLTGGLFGLYVLWYARGRDEPEAQPAGVLAEPPSDLAPGLEHDPDRTSRRYALLGLAGLLVAVLIGIGALSLADRVPAVLCLPFAVGVVSVGAVLLARELPRTTSAGEEAGETSCDG